MKTWRMCVVVVLGVAAVLLDIYLFQQLCAGLADAEHTNHSPVLLAPPVIAFGELFLALLVTVVVWHSNLVRPSHRARGNRP